MTKMTCAKCGSMTFRATFLWADLGKCYYGDQGAIDIGAVCCDCGEGVSLLVREANKLTSEEFYLMVFRAVEHMTATGGNARRFCEGLARTYAVMPDVAERNLAASRRGVRDATSL